MTDSKTLKSFYHENKQTAIQAWAGAGRFLPCVSKGGEIVPDDAKAKRPFEQVPVELLEDKALTEAEIVYYILLVKLSHVDGYCSMSSRELGKLRGKGMRTAQRVVESLKKKGYIKTVVYTDERGNSHRKISPIRYVKCGRGVRFDIGGYDKSGEGAMTDLSPTYVKNGTQIILNNHTDNNHSANQDLRNSVPSQKGKTKRKKFVPPSLDEVEQYVEENGLAIDARRFFDFYTAGEWHDSSGKPVKNWKQKALTWDRREQENRKSKPPASGPVVPTQESIDKRNQENAAQLDANHEEMLRRIEQEGMI